MATIKGSETEKNLLKAFAGESQARNRYMLFALQAQKDGFEQIAAIFEETANQEVEHARRFFSFLEGGDLEITAAYPAGIVGSTGANLKASAGGEHEEWAIVYPKFAEIAVAEGFKNIGKVFEFVATAEKQHEDRYLALLKNVEQSLVFERKEEVLWRCRRCCYTVKGTKAPVGCPTCGATQAHFELFVPNY